MDYFRVFCSVFTAVFTLIDVTVRKEATVSNLKHEHPIFTLLINCKYLFLKFFASHICINKIFSSLTTKRKKKECNIFECQTSTGSLITSYILCQDSKIYNKSQEDYIGLDPITRRFPGINVLFSISINMV